jgi:hypothetical protein
MAVGQSLSILQRLAGAGGTIGRRTARHLVGRNRSGPLRRENYTGRPQSRERVHQSHPPHRWCIPTPIDMPGPSRWGRAHDHRDMALLVGRSWPSTHLDPDEDERSDEDLARIVANCPHLESLRPAGPRESPGFPREGDAGRDSTMAVRDGRGGACRLGCARGGDSRESTRRCTLRPTSYGMMRHLHRQGHRRRGAV